MLFLMAIADLDRRSKLEEIYRTYRRELYITAYAMVKKHEVAEDMVQSALLKVNDYLDKINEIKCQKTKAYMITIVKNLCRDYFKEDQVGGVVMKDVQPIEAHFDLQDGTNLIEEHVIRDEDAQEMALLLEEINPAYCEMIQLRYYDQLTIDEISQVLNITKNNVSVRLKRALMALEKVIYERSESA